MSTPAPTDESLRAAGRTLGEHAEFMARHIFVPHCNPYFVAATQHQQDRVISDLRAQILAELIALEAEFAARFFIKL